jgi:predicted phosphodiesterase
MRVAVFSDVHGNIVALDAVMGVARDEGIDHFWCLGDLVAHGPRPAEASAFFAQELCATWRWVDRGVVRDRPAGSSQRPGEA